MKIFTITVLVLIFTATGFSQRLINSSDVYHVRHVEELALSPDKKWVAYCVSIADSIEDKNDQNIWMTSIDGSGSIQLTYSKDDEGT
ncbi:MAG: hypothetical protein ABJA70_09115, partial [Chryseolinea sp.]